VTIKQWIRDYFRFMGFEETDRDHFCYAFVKLLENGNWLYVGKHLEEGGSDLPTMLGEPVYEEWNSDSGEYLDCKYYETLSDYMREKGL
jgi:hypothetical protein